MLSQKNPWFTKLLAALFCCFLLNGSLQAAPVFKVSKNNSSIYIGGTFHILMPSDFPLQDAFYEAYKQADELYFETDIEATNSSPKFQAMMMDVMFLKNGESLASQLSASTFKALSEYLSSKGMSIEPFLKLTPTGAMLTMTIMEYQARGFTLAGVDQHLFEKAKADKKSIKWFESIEEQVAFIDSLDANDPDQLIAYMLESMDGLDAVVNNLHSAWKQGDMALLEKTGLTEFEDFPDTYNTFIKDRNAKWMKTILPMFSDNNIEFILVGALHLPGKDGLLTQLRAKGYTIKQIN